MGKNRDRPFEAKDYDSTFDAFRRHRGLKAEQWADHAGISRKLLFEYRAKGALPRSDNFARLVRGASSLLGRRVRASELYDLGENEPVATVRVPLAGGLSIRYDSRLDRTLAQFNVGPLTLARLCQYSGRTILKIRQGHAASLVTIAEIVRTLRRHGYPVRAQDVIDVGEE